MSADRKSARRCAIYTRKSSEEGLEQSFNSLDAQREACHAYVVSQRHEGWRPLDRRYDDGGYSGGTMERPALKTLLEDIKAGKIDVVVVYKVDRLTRSLADFAKMIEVFDGYGVSFVSVTQQFSTTSSMGRLTLNVLLSFAQFEREVTGERIRDKIAASKQKGMWMGGMVPAGYDLRDRKLIVNPEEAERVRWIYRSYLKLGCVAKLKAQLDKMGIKTRMRVSKEGHKYGGSSYSRGALYGLLKNRVYLGETKHRGHSYPGEHEAIVTRELWGRVQARLTNNNDARRNGISARNPSLLAGLIYDEQGNRFTPSHAVKDGKRYRYYISQAVIHHKPGLSKCPARIPAQEIERVVCFKLQSFLESKGELIDALALGTDTAEMTQELIASAQTTSKALRSGATTQLRQFVRSAVVAVVVMEKTIDLSVNTRALRHALLKGSSTTVPKVPHSSDAHAKDEILKIPVKAHLRRCGGEVRLVIESAAEDGPTRPVPSMIKGVARAHSWYEQIIQGASTGRRSIGKRTGVDERYVALILRCAFLAPDIVEAILDGRQPATLTRAKIASRLPMSWIEQRERLGFALSQH